MPPPPSSPADPFPSRTAPPAVWLASALAAPLRADALARWSRDPSTLIPVPTGVRWDAVSLPADLSRSLLGSLLGDRYPLGPVLRDERTCTDFWLVALGPAAPWSTMHPRAARVAGPIGMPDPQLRLVRAGLPRNRAAAVTWAHWPTATGTLTPPVWFASALIDAHRNRGPG